MSVSFSDATATAPLALALASGMRIEPCTQIDVGLSRCFQCGKVAHGSALLAVPEVNAEVVADADDVAEKDSEEDDRDGDGAISDWVTTSEAALAAVIARLFSSLASMRR